MKLPARFSRVLALAFACGRLAFPAFCADDRAPQRKLRYFGSFDYFLPANSGSGLGNQLRSEAEVLIAKGYASANYSVNTNGGAGTRVGALYPIDAKTEMGGSVGYVIGPTMNATFAATSGVFGNGGKTVNRSVIFIRSLAEWKTHVPLSSRWSFVLGSGAGAAFGRLDRSCEDTGSLICTDNSTHQSWTGFTWEFSPTFAYRGKTVEVSFGVRYSGFPKFNGNDQIAPISWTALGFFLGASL